MFEYMVTIRRTLCGRVFVDAETESAAIDKVKAIGYETLFEDREDTFKAIEFAAENL